MSFTLRLGSITAVLALVLTACAGPGATTRPATPGPGTPAATSAATPAVTPGAATPAATPGEPTPEPATADPGASPTPTPPPPAVEGTLTIWADETRTPILQALGADFEAEHGVPVSVAQVGFGDIRDQLQLRGPANEGPDIIIGAHDWLGQLVTNGLVEPLELGAATDSIDPVALEAFTYDGTVYGLPYAAEAIALYHNTDLVPTAPATWDELMTMAADLQKNEGLEQAFVLQEKDPYHSYPILTANGGYIFGRNEDGSYNPEDVGLDSEGGIAYANMLDQMVKDGLLRAGVNYDTMISLFNSGESAMFMTGPWALAGDTGIRAGGQPFAVAPIPAGSETARPFVGVQGVMVSFFAPNKLLAETFVTEYVATTETMQAFFDADPRPSTWTEVAEGIDDPEVAAFVASAATGDPLPAIPEMSAVWTDWTDALDLIFTQQQDAEGAITDAAESIRATIAGP